LTLLEDTRQQKGKHKNVRAYCEQQGIKIVRQMLNVGDYMLAGPEYGGIKGDIAVDSKKDVAEIAGNCFQDHTRFRDECQRAQELGIRLIVLIEEMPPGGDLDNWVSPLDRFGNEKYQFNPKTLKKTMATMTERYGVRFRFCDGRSTGRLLLEYLKGERT